MSRDRPSCALTVLGILSLLALLPALAAPAAAQCTGLPGCVLEWADDFDGSAVDPGK